LGRARVSYFYQSIVSGNFRDLRRVRLISPAVTSQSNGYIKRLEEGGKVVPLGDKMFGDSKKD
jgi:hypothetical protein